MDVIEPLIYHCWIKFRKNFSHVLYPVLVSLLSHNSILHYNHFREIYNAMYGKHIRKKDCSIVKQTQISRDQLRFFIQHV